MFLVFNQLIKGERCYSLWVLHLFWPVFNGPYSKQQVPGGRTCRARSAPARRACAGPRAGADPSGASYSSRIRLPDAGGYRAELGHVLACMHSRGRLHCPVAASVEL